MGGFLIMAAIFLLYFGIAVGAIVLLVYFFRQRQKEKREESKKDYSDY